MKYTLIIKTNNIITKKNILPERTTKHIHAVPTNGQIPNIGVTEVLIHSEKLINKRHLLLLLMF